MGVSIKGKLQQTTENRDTSIFPNYLYGVILTKDIETAIGVAYPSMFCEYKGEYNRWAGNVTASNKIAKKLLARIVKDETFARKALQKQAHVDAVLGQLCAEIKVVKVGVLTNKELSNILTKLTNQYTEEAISHWLPLGVEGFNSEFTNYLLNFLRKKLDDEELANEYFVVLTTPTKKTRKLAKPSKESIAKQNRYAKKVLDGEALYRRLFETMREFAFMKNWSKETFELAERCMERLLKEIGARSNVGLELAKSMVLEELTKALASGKLPENLKVRQRHCIFVFGAGEYELIVGKAKVEDFLKKYLDVPVVSKRADIKGQVAQTGIAKGVVRRIESAKDMYKFKEGEVLVSSKTLPDFVPIMRKAAAIVTDYGGITCHAAIVSRELGVPCVIGTKIATRVLKDGDVVIVDAKKGIVHRL